MSVTWIKTSVALGLTMLTTVFHTPPVEAGGFGRFVVGQVLNNSPRAQMIAGTVAPIVQTAQMQGGRLSPGQIVQAVSDGRNLVQNLRASSGQSDGGGQIPMEMPMMQDQSGGFPGMQPQDPSIQPVSYSAPAYADPTPPQGPPQGQAGGPPPQAGNSPIDLVVENIIFAEPANKVVGPAYKVQVRNQGSVPAAKFSIGLFASNDGKVNEKCPKAFLEVRDLAPNTVAEYTIRLPLAAEKMVDADTKEAKPYTHVATAVDFFGLIPEADESNNTAILLRDEIDGATKVAEVGASKTAETTEAAE